jgi:tetratricopeptide (TPR) repeat protein
MPGRLSSRVIAGRAAELAELDAALERCANGAAGVVLVGGEAGVGKTRLVNELTSRARATGVRVLTGQCAGLREAAIPLLPIADALGTVPDAEAPAELARLRRGFERRALAVPETVAPARGFAEILGLLRRLTESAPVLVAVEDVHWADRSTLELLSFVIARLGDERLLVLVTYRSDELDSGGALREFVAEATRRSLVQRLELSRLNRADVAVQLEGILGAPPERRLADAVFARSDGNPLFTEELAAAANDDADALPATLRDMLLARIEALSTRAQEVVRVAAVGGVRVDHQLLSAAAALDDRALIAAAREAVRHHVLMNDDDALAFRHPLLQEAAYAELLPGERARLHRACATAIEHRPQVAGGNAATVAAQIAHHWLRAGDRPRALAAAVRAGAEAQRVHGLAEAAEHYGRALELWDAVPHAEMLAGTDRSELLARAAEATAWSGAPARAIELVDAAIALVDELREPVRAGLLHERRGFYLWWDNRGDEAVADYQRAVRLVPAQPPSRERAHVLAGLGFILMLAGRPAESRERCTEAIQIARSVGVRAAEVRALATLGVDHSYLGDHGAGIAALREARTLAREADDPDVLAHTAAGLCDVFRRAGRLEEAVAVGLEGAEDCRRAGLDLAQGSFCALNAAEAAFELGSWDLVERVADDVLAREPTGMSLLFAHDILGLLDTARGRLDAAAAHLAAARELAGTELGAQPDAMLCHAEAELALWQGDPDAAWSKANEAAGFAANDAGLPQYPELATVAARAAADRADRDRARHRDPASACDQAHALRAAVDVIHHPAVLATVEAETGVPRAAPHRSYGNQPPPRGRPGARPTERPTLAGARPKRCSPRRRAEQRQPTRCTPRGRAPTASAPSPCSTRSTRSHGAPDSRRPPRSHSDTGPHARPCRRRPASWASPRASSRSSSTSPWDKPTARSPASSTSHPERRDSTSRTSSTSWTPPLGPRRPPPLTASASSTELQSVAPSDRSDHERNRFRRDDRHSRRRQK